MSKNALKRHLRKLAKKSASAASSNPSSTATTSSNNNNGSNPIGSKSSRANITRSTGVIPPRAAHRSVWSPPLPSQLSSPVIHYLETLESALRKKHTGSSSRPSVLEDCHGSMIFSPLSGPYVNKGLTSIPIVITSLTSLDLSSNYVSNLTGISRLSSLKSLNLSRNIFIELDPEILSCKNLEILDLTHNMLRCSSKALLIPHWSNLSLKTLDLRYNNKVNTVRIHDKLKECCRGTVLVTVNNFGEEGEGWGERDEGHLRSQLEPWNTAGLRRRLVTEFKGKLMGLEYEREQVMEELIKAYDREGPREIVYVESERKVDPGRCSRLLGLLRGWSSSFKNGNEERKSVKAENYMILTKVEHVSSRNKSSAAKKLCEYTELWREAEEAMYEHDPGFDFTAIAVTHNFKGSPHIDRQNSGPFYGLSLGRFRGGGIRVEVTARVVADVCTRERFGKVDGRFPHWVNEWDGEERFSLIFYRTEGAVEEVQAAIFEVPRTLEEMQEAQKSNQIVPFTKVNGFTAGHDGGNPAGVVLPEIAKTVPPASRVAVAHAIGYSETCFVDSIETNPLRISLNYYTPVEQVDVCGHATVACLGLLLKEGLLPAPVADNGGMIEGALNLQCGEVRFEIVGQEVFMSQLPVRVAALEEDSLKRLLECLRVKEEDLDDALFLPCLASTGLWDIMVALKHEETLDSLAPDFRLMSSLSKDLDAVGVHVCVRTPKNCWKVRNFAPRFGINEESATGTSNCALAGVLGRAGAMKWGERCVFEQGDGMGASSRILVRLGARAAEPAWVGGRYKIMESSSVTESIE
ncbi:hypothetical protein TrVE_jg7900 [Triparma verrucosa]|uniref:Uncharacterized protein n=1 Tax=Triparma verrucosa TaxID=1606542 RepID=A0A9W7CCP8_9STRA|nr:hypothetical protein TrVE_jg7900 [Triparma verrucosa]